MKNIHHLVFASGYKSMVRVLQSIGRGIRIVEGKKCLRLYDIIDDLRFKSKSTTFSNYSMQHMEERIKIYEKESFTWTEQKIELN